LLNIRMDFPKTEEWAKKSIPYLRECLEELRVYILENPFKKRSEEIYFFKYVKPVVMGRLIFMCEVHNKEIFRSMFDQAKEKDYLADEVEEIDAFFKRKDHLYQLFKDDQDGFDIKFFVRDVDDRFQKRELPIEIDPVLFYGDPNFSTGLDYAFAQFHAYELLRNHLENELEALLIVGDEVPNEPMKFTGSAADFVSMIEIFQRVGRPMNPETGKPATNNELYQLFKKGFNPDLSDDLDFETLKLTSGDSDLPERMLDALDKLKHKWDNEERDIDYDDPEGGKPKK